MTMQALLEAARSGTSSVRLRLWLAVIAILPIVIAACGNNNNGGNGY